MSRATELKARADARQRILDDHLHAARLSAELSYTSEPCRLREHTLCGGHTDAGVNSHPQCLCKCHDPENTYWVWWRPGASGELHVAGMVSGPYDTADEAIDDGFAGKRGEGQWIREQIQNRGHMIEQVDEERWDALTNWDLRSETARAALRPQPRNETA